MVEDTQRKPLTTSVAQTLPQISVWNADTPYISWGGGREGVVNLGFLSLKQPHELSLQFRRGTRKTIRQVCFTLQKKLSTKNNRHLPFSLH